MTIRPLTPVLADRAKNELNEEPNRLKNDLQILKDWIAKQPHLRARTDRITDTGSLSLRDRVVQCWLP